jgi:hypothetical protein
MKYKKPEATEIRGICVLCKKNPQKSKPKGKYTALCSPCTKRLYEPGRNRNVTKYKDKIERPYRKHVKSQCQSCGFKSEFLCQFDVDHIDGDHTNNCLTNLQTLCANCHRLKTHLNQDWKK